MQTVCYTKTVTVRRPSGKVVDINDYRKKPEQAPLCERAPAPVLSQKAVRRRLLRRRMELLGVLLELCVSTSLLVLILTATARFFFL